MTTTTSESAMPASVRDRAKLFYWSVRRELWEHRSIYIGPLAAAGVVLFGALIGATGLHHIHATMGSLSLGKREEVALASYGFAAMAIMVTGLIVGVLYCLGALHNERRDRTILFWKSLPVSDLITVLSKASVPLAVLPAVVFAITVALQLCMLAIADLADAGAVAETFSPLLWTTQVQLYSLVVAVLWYAPLVGWLLLVSAWARRAPFLWAFLPPLALIVLEKIAFDTNRFGAFLAYRLGLYRQAFSYAFFDLPKPDPVRFLTNPDVWTGLGVAAAFLAAGVWVRRYREPI